MEPFEQRHDSSKIGKVLLLVQHRPSQRFWEDAVLKGIIEHGGDFLEIPFV